MRSFTTAGKQTSEETFEGAEPLKFVLDDSEYIAYPPTPAQFAVFMSSQAESRESQDHVAGVIDFFDGLLEEEARRTFRRRLLDRDDPFDFDMVQEIMEWLVEEWAARPTKPSSDSPSSRTTTGPRSTAKRRSTASTS